MTGENLFFSGKENKMEIVYFSEFLQLIIYFFIYLVRLQKTEKHGFCSKLRITTIRKIGNYEYLETRTTKNSDSVS
jgi:hypothetical protein